MSDYNQRQYILMLDRLNAYEKGHLEVAPLIVDIEGLINALEGVPFSLKQEFLHSWGKLEVARAVALSRGSNTLDKQGTEIVGRGVAELKMLVLNLIDDPADKTRSP